MYSKFNKEDYIKIFLKIKLKIYNKFICTFIGFILQNTIILLKDIFVYAKQKLTSFCFINGIYQFYNGYYIVFFPHSKATFCCGLCGIVSIKKKLNHKKKIDTISLIKTVKLVDSQNGYYLFSGKSQKIDNEYLGGNDTIKGLLKKVRLLKRNNIFLDLFFNKKSTDSIKFILNILANRLKEDSIFLEKLSKMKNTNLASAMSNRLEILKDIVWCLSSELIQNLEKIRNIIPNLENLKENQVQIILFFKQINSVLNSIDRLEVRGRDSAGISILFILTLSDFNKFKIKLINTDLMNEFIQRQLDNLLINKNISCKQTKDNNDQIIVSITITYKIASEIGNLGDNTIFLRKEIKNDQILANIIDFSNLYYTISSHTRWASIGAITEPNCHPIDNKMSNGIKSKQHIIHICLNGEIDNYLELKAASKVMCKNIQEEITTDTKIIPIKIEEYINKGIDIIDAFRLTVNNFEGSHAIIMHTNLAPGKLLIAQKGSGQSMFIGLAENFYMPASEVYGFVEETNKFLRMEGDKAYYNRYGNKIKGQIFILDQKSQGKISDIIAMYYDGTPINLTKSDIKYTDITSRDTDRKGFKHYFLKEIYESPSSVEQTLNNKWEIKQVNGNYSYVLKLSKDIIPLELQNALKLNLIKRIFFVGQGTAGIAAEVCSNILKYFLANSRIQVTSSRASEFSGFELNRSKNYSSLDNTLVIAISQSGTTTDTNRTIDIARNRNAYTLAIVNRRDSDITFKVDGVMYTSSGRDIEMSVASTKAFYSQIVAGNILCLKIADLVKARTKKFLSNQIEELLKLPKQMRKIFNIEKSIKKSAEKLTATKNYWAIVGSGFSKTSADEIRIKLSELCYKTISSDFIEDKKHIDLSSEPLILVCAAGLQKEVREDVIKDIAIFQAHKAIPVVIADEDEKRFEPYAEIVFYVPKISKYLAPILNTLVGHIWGYYAALSINKASKLLSNFRDSIQDNIDNYAIQGFDAFEIVRKKSFRSKINRFYRKLRLKIKDNDNPLNIAYLTDLTLLLKYLSGKLPVSDFEIDFGKKGTAIEMLKVFLKTIDKSINNMSRPVDAIRHQAKTITVGTSRISSKVKGMLFEIVKAHEIRISQITSKNIIIMKNLQKIVHKIQGSVLYVITKLNSLGEPDEITEIKIKSKSGILKSMPSRVEDDKELKGIKRIVVSRGDIYVGKGRKDSQNVIIIPASSNIPKESDKIKYLLLLNIVFKKQILLKTKIKALGGKYENIKNIVHENSLKWDDTYIDNMKADDLFGFSAEKVAEHIVLEKSVGTI